jgi:RimJ/RimL family protein N-acetyltransferase
MSKPELATERLLLRPFELDDARRVEELAGNAAIADTTMHIPHPYPAGLGAEWISRHAANWKEGRSVTFAIVRRTDNVLMGAISLGFDPENESAEMGYWLGEPYWNQGYTTEAARAVIEFGFEKVGLNRIFAQYLTRNPASGRVMAKAGMQYEGCLRQRFKKGDHFEDVGVYAILKSDKRI